MPETEKQTLPGALAAEIERCRGVLKEYEALGPVGQLGAYMIQGVILRSMKALASGDAVSMIRAFEALKLCK